MVYIYIGTIDAESGEYNPFLAYTYTHNTIRNQLMGVSLVLSDHSPGSGGFCVVRGSHKSNFKTPLNMIHGLGGEKFGEFVTQPVTQAGDVVLFSEGRAHLNLT